MFAAPFIWAGVLFAACLDAIAWPPTDDKKPTA